MRIVLAGASGAVGSQVLTLLAGRDVVVVGRRALTALPPGAAQLTGEIAEWPALIAATTADVAICALGTTMKQAGSKAAFARVDLDAVLSFAKAAKQAGAQHFLMVSSVGADASSNNFYLATKGAAESGVRALGFERVDLFRPGLLRTDRGGPPRPGERIGIAVSPLTDWLTPRAYDRYRSIAARDVAAAIVRAVDQTVPGCFIHHNREMWG